MRLKFLSGIIVEGLDDPRCSHMGQEWHSRMEAKDESRNETIGLEPLYLWNKEKDLKNLNNFNLWEFNCKGKKKICYWSFFNVGTNCIEKIGRAPRNSEKSVLTR